MPRIILIFLLSLIFTACKKTVTPDIIPFVIETELANKENAIFRAFALKDGSFVLVTDIYDGNTTTFHKYSNDLKLVKTVILPCRRISEPVYYNDGTFVVLADNYDQNGGTWAVHLNNDFEVLQKRSLEILIVSGNAARYGESITRLANGNIVYAATNENVSTPGDKIIMFCIADIFKDTKPLWRNYPSNYNGDWVNTLTSFGNNIYISGNDHLGQTESFVLKYDSAGNQIFKKSWSFFFDFPHLHIENDRIIYQTSTELFALNQAGSDIMSVKIGEDWYTRKSPIIKKGDYYYYSINVADAAGRFNEVRKSDQNLNQLKSIKLGNQRTNVNVWTDGYLLKLTNDQLVSVMHIQNPVLSGNQWLIQKLTDDLEIVD